MPATVPIDLPPRGVTPCTTPRDRSAAAFALVVAALAGATAAAAQAPRLSEVMSDNPSSVPRDDGRFADWLELHNPHADTLRLGGYHLGDGDFAGSWPLPDTTLPPGGYLLVWAAGRGSGPGPDGLTADFALDKDGEAAYLYAADGRLVDETPARPIPTDVSLGRPPGRAEWVYYPTPTPWAPNDSLGLSAAPPPPTFSRAAGSGLREPFSLVLVPPRPSDTIRYTLDGSSPTSASPRYSAPLTITDDVVVRARTLRTGALPSKTATATYLFGDTTALAVLSIALDSAAIFGARGLYTRPTSGGELAVSAEFFEPDGRLGFAQVLGLRMHAPDRYLHKSMRLYARERYGAEAIEYPLFGELPVERFRRIVLRNGGNDGTEKGKLHVKDAVVHRLYEQMRPRHATAAYRPVSVFVNGDYFGLYNLRERQDAHYLETHYGYDCGEVDFLEYDYAESGGEVTRCGDWVAWNALKAYLQREDMSTDEALAHVAARVDLDDFTDYQCLEIFIGNADWLNNNIKFWRPRADGARWRFLLWDTEYGLGTTSENAAGQPDFDYVTMALDWGGWGRGDHTWMLRGLTTHPRYRERFLRRYLDLLNTYLSTGHVLAELDAAAEAIRPELPRQLARWGKSPEVYERHLRHTRDFVTRRGRLTRRNAARAFGLDTATYRLTVDVSDAAAGRVRVNTVTPAEGATYLRGAGAYPWTGTYLQALRTTVTALPRPGYRFAHWGTDAAAVTPTIELAPGVDTTLVAVFAPADATDAPPLYLNEVLADNAGAYADPEGRYSDWVEVYNAGAEAIDLAGYFLTDDADAAEAFRIPDADPAATTVPPGGHLLLYADGDTTRGPRHLPFKLSRDGETVRLFRRASDGTLVPVDEVTFPPLGEDEGYARIPDGSGPWVRTATPTPAAVNERTSAIGEASVPAASLRIYPNPTHGTVFLSGAAAAARTVEVVDAVGRARLRRRITDGRLDLSVLPQGAYVLRVEDEATGRQSVWRVTLLP